VSADPTPPALLRALALPTKKGGAKAEKEYADWHRLHGQPLKRKYRQS